MNDQKLKETSYKMTTLELVGKSAVGAFKTGCSGIMASARATTTIQRQVRYDFLTATSPIWNRGDQSQNQVRTISVFDTNDAGSNYVVAGRPIHDAGRQRKVAAEYQVEIQNTFEADTN